MTLRCPDCDSIDIELVDDNGVTDPANGDRVEWYECACGHRFKKVLHA